MHLSKQILIFLVATLLYSCKAKTKSPSKARYPYAISDFPESLQPDLVRLVEKGIVEGNDTSLRKASDADLIRLGNAEHPLLRVAAFREIMERPSFNHFDVVMNHLDDTALVFFDVGEFGIKDGSVSDDILFNTTWKTEAEKDKMVEEVLSRHNYLQAAYAALWSLEPREKHYQSIREMASRSTGVWGFELNFGSAEDALNGLASFRKKEDIPLIKERLLERCWKISDKGFQLMQNFPDTAYMDVLEKYHEREFYNFTGFRPHGFTGFPTSNAAPEDFIRALVVQQSDRSAALLDTMLTILPKMGCFPDKESVTNAIITEIWDHPCPAYARLREKIRRRAEELNKNRGILTMIPSTGISDTTKRTIRW